MGNGWKGSGNAHAGAEARTFQSGIANASDLLSLPFWPTQVPLGLRLLLLLSLSFRAGGCGGGGGGPGWWVVGVGRCVVVASVWCVCACGGIRWGWSSRMVGPVGVGRCVVVASV